MLVQSRGNARLLLVLLLLVHWWLRSAPSHALPLLPAAWGGHLVEARAHCERRAHRAAQLQPTSGANPAPMPAYGAKPTIASHIIYMFCQICLFCDILSPASGARPTMECMFLLPASGAKPTVGCMILSIACMTLLPASGAKPTTASVASQVRSKSLA